MQQMLAAVQAGTSAKPVIGFVDSGYAISGGILSNTSASGISLMGVSQDSITYVPTHANIEAALKDWVKGNSQTISDFELPAEAYRRSLLDYQRQLAHRIKRGRYHHKLWVPALQAQLLLT